MGIFDAVRRIGNIIVGRTEIQVAKQEVKNSEAVFNVVIDKARLNAQETANDYRQAEILAQQSQEEIENLESSIVEQEKHLQKALKLQDKTLGSMIIQKIDVLKIKLAEAYTKYANLSENAKDIGEVAQQVKQRVVELEEKSVLAQSTLKAEEVRKEALLRQQNLATDFTSKALRSVEQKVAEAQSAGKVDKKLKAESYEGKLEEMYKKSSADDAAARFEEMLKNPQ